MGAMLRDLSKEIQQTAKRNGYLLLPGVADDPRTMRVYVQLKIRWAERMLLEIKYQEDELPRLNRHEKARLAHQLIFSDVRKALHKMLEELKEWQANLTAVQV